MPESPEAEKWVKDLDQGTRPLLFANSDLTLSFDNAVKEYEQSIVGSQEKSLRQFSLALEKKVNTKKFREISSNIIRFFDLSQLTDEILNYHLFVFPVSSSKSIIAFFWGNNIFIPQMPGSLNEHHGLILHELVHILFRKSNVRNLIKSVVHPCKSMALKYLEDSLTTAIGNRYAQNKFVPGTKEKPGAFADPIFDQSSLKILPLIESYLDSGKTIDVEFLQQFVDIFSKTFPDCMKNFRCILYGDPIISDFDMMSVFSMILDKGFQDNDILSWEEREKAPNARIFIINNSRQTEGITKEKDSLWIRFDDHGYASFTIQTDDQAKIQKALSWLHKHPVIEKEMVISLAD